MPTLRSYSLNGMARTVVRTFISELRAGIAQLLSERKGEGSGGGCQRVERERSIRRRRVSV
jgi:hypothetical protein